MGSYLMLFVLLQEYLLRVFEETQGWFVSNTDLKKKSQKKFGYKEKKITY